jgi:hypothetical protein
VLLLLLLPLLLCHSRCHLSCWACFLIVQQLANCSVIYAAEIIIDPIAAVNKIHW